MDAQDKQDQIAFKRFGHSIPLLSSAPPSLKEIIEKQNEREMKEVEPNLYLATHDLVNHYKRNQEIDEYDGLGTPMLLTESMLSARKEQARAENKDLDASCNNYGEYTDAQRLDFKAKSNALWEKLYKNGYTACSAIRVSDTLIPRGNDLDKLVEETRRELNKNGLIATVENIQKKNPPKDLPRRQHFDTYLVVLKNKLDRDANNEAIEIPLSNVTHKLLAVALHKGLIDEAFLKRNGIDADLGLLPGLLRELKTQGHFTPEPQLPAANAVSAIDKQDTLKKNIENHIE